MGVIENVVALIVTLSILVTIHEFGHFWVARLCGVKVLRFSIGFGKPLWSFRGRPVAHAPVPEGQEIRTRSNEPDEGTEFAVAAIPLGGYVKMLDEREGFVPDDQLHLAYNRKPVLQRIAIAAAGPAANFLLAIVAYWLLYSVGVAGYTPRIDAPRTGSVAEAVGFERGDEVLAVDGEGVTTWSDLGIALFGRIGDTGVVDVTVRPAGGGTSVRRVEIERWLSDVDEPDPLDSLGLSLWSPPIPAVIAAVLPGEAGELGGLRAGDRVISAAGERIDHWQALVDRISASPGMPLPLVVVRDGFEIDLTLVPGTTERGGKTVGYIGASRESFEMPPDMQRMTDYGVVEALVPALDKTWSVTVFTLDAIRKMVVGAISPSNLSGPITIAQIAGTTASYGLESFINFLALLSISLGVLNLMPIPVLDGGHLLYYFIELIAGRPVPERVQIWGLQAGMFIIVSIMLLALYNDLVRLAT